MRINRETRDTRARETLVSEAWLRRWLLRSRVPCWTAPSIPGHGSRYSIMVGDGTRLIVEPSIVPGTWDRAVAACCSAAAVVNSLPETGEAVFSGWLALPELQAYLPGTALNPPGDLPSFLGVPRGFWAAYIGGSVRLFLAGEPKPPKRGLEGVRLYTQRRHRREGKRVSWTIRG